MLPRVRIVSKQGADRQCKVLGQRVFTAGCRSTQRGKAPNFLMKRHLRNLRKNTPLHKLLREVMLLNEQWEEARTAHADARTSMNPQLATNFAKTVIPAVNDKLRSNLTNYVLNEALKQVQASAIYGVALCSMKQDRPCVPSGHTSSWRGAQPSSLQQHYKGTCGPTFDIRGLSSARALRHLYQVHNQQWAQQPPFCPPKRQSAGPRLLTSLWPTPLFSSTRAGLREPSASNAVCNSRGLRLHLILHATGQGDSWEQAGNNRPGQHTEASAESSLPSHQPEETRQAPSRQPLAELVQQHAADPVCSQAASSYGATSQPPTGASRRPPLAGPPTSKRTAAKCGACDALGHRATYGLCPAYGTPCE